MPEVFYTVGHSTRTIPELVELLREAGVQVLVDVRTVPRSRTNPQFNRDVLRTTLAGYEIGYEHIAELGGLRGRAAETSPNGFWQNRSFRSYADHAMTDSFRSGLARLRALGRERTAAVMCAEAVWWRCHRRIIADYLIVGGCEVFHIMGPGKTEPAALTAGARPVAGQVPGAEASQDVWAEGIVYPAPDAGA